jgi:uncharacterized protein
MQKPEITYPCTWPYRVIGEDVTCISKEIAERLKERYRFELEMGNVSRLGKYVSVHVEVDVVDEAQRNSVFTLLKSISGVKMVF